MIWKLHASATNAKKRQRIETIVENYSAMITRR